MGHKNLVVEYREIQGVRTSACNGIHSRRPSPYSRYTVVSSERGYRNLVKISRS